MNIIVFGTGKVGKDAVRFLEKDYRILFLTDNDEKKWKTIFGNYLIESPDNIKKYDCNIVITSARYGIEIAEQLQSMGVSRDRIYFYRNFYDIDTCGYEIYPLCEEKVQSTEFTLSWFDLYHAEEHITNNKKILIFCVFFSGYTQQLIENMSGKYKDIEFSLLTSTKEYKKKLVSKQLKHIYYFRTMADLKAILEQIPLYDAMQLLWIEREWSYFYKLIRKKTRRLNLNVGGSDFYRTGRGEKDFKRNLIACADNITAETVSTVREFQLYYGKSIKNEVRLLPFGIEVLELINKNKEVSKDVIKRKYHIPFDKMVVTCGHNASNEHQHTKIIEALCHLPVNVKERLVCVFPMTYPREQDEYINDIMNKLEKTDLEYVILTEFMSLQEMAEYARISDIMIHVQKTDQLSSTMLEEMYAGSIVIAGKWLPYQSLRDLGLFFLDIDTISDVAICLEKIILNMEEYREKCTGNEEIIWKYSSWEKLSPMWYQLWK